MGFSFCAVSVDESGVQMLVLYRINKRESEAR